VSYDPSITSSEAISPQVRSTAYTLFLVLLLQLVGSSVLLYLIDDARSNKNEILWYR